MKIFSCIVTSLMFWVTISSAQVEQGDSEIRFLGFYSQMVGTENDFGGSGSVQLSYGYFLTPFLQIGVGPQISFSEGANAGSTEVSFSGSAFFNYNFSTSSKTISAVLEARWPILSNFLPTLTPGVSRSTMKHVMPRCPADGSVLTKMTKKWAKAGLYTLHHDFMRKL